jgi:putative transposase
MWSPQKCARWPIAPGSLGNDLSFENSRLRKAVSDLTLDKLILQEAARGNF